MDWRFGERRWLKHLEFTVVAAIAIAAACVMIGQSAERYAETAADPIAVAADANPAPTRPQDRNAPVFNAIDYATTGSVKGQTVVISPCGAQPAH